MKNLLRKNRVELILVALAALLLARVAFIAVGYDPETHYPGGGFDAFEWDVQDWNGHYWNLWHFSKVYQGEVSFFHTRYEFFPEGLATANVHGDLFTKAVAGLIGLVCSPDTTFFLMVLLVLAGNIFGGYVLVRRLTGNRFAAAGVGLFLAFAGVSAWAVNTGNLEYGIFLWVLLYLTFLDRVLEGARWADVASGALFGALAVMGNMVFFFHVVTLSLVLVGFRYAELDRRRLVAVVALALGAAVLLAPMGAAFVSTGDSAAPAFQEAVPRLDGTDVGTEFGVPALNSYEAENYLPWVHQRLREDSHTTFAVVLLVVAALLLATPQTLPWVVAGLIFLALSFGPYHVENPESGTPVVTRLPYYFFHRWVPFYARVHFPHRIFGFGILSLAIAAGFGLDALGHRLRTVGHRAWLVPLVLALLLGGEAAARWGVRTSEKPPEVSYFDELGREPNDYAMIVVPFDLGVLDARHLYYQTRHGKPLFNGAFPRYIGKALPNDRLLHENSLLYNLYVLQFDELPRDVRDIFIRIGDGPFKPDRATVRKDIQELFDLGFRKVVLHKELRFQTDLAIQLPQESSVRDFLDEHLAPASHEDDDVVVYDLSTALK